MAATTATPFGLNGELDKMGAPKKLDKRIYVTTILEESQREALRHIAYINRKSMAELFRSAIEKLINDEKRLIKTKGK